MKKCHIVATVVLCACVLFTSVVCAESTYYDNITHKLGRGVINTCLSPIELFRSLDKRIDDLGVASGISVGIFHGIGRGIARAVTGVFDIVTFLVPVPTFDTYFMEPEFVAVNDITSTA